MRVTSSIATMAALLCSAAILHAQTAVAQPAAANEEPIRLSPFVVTSSSNVGYGSLTSNSSSRLNEQVIDIPQVVNVVTSEFMRDSQLLDSREALKYVSNVIPETNNHNLGVFLIRGLRSASTFIDGSLTSHGAHFDTAFYDRVEVVKGPTSAAFGRGEPAGLINYITKTPQRKVSDTVTTTVGSENLYRVELDHDGVVRDGKPLYYRLNAFYHESDSLRDTWHYRRAGEMLSVLWDLSPRTTITFQESYQDTRAPVSEGNTFFKYKPTTDLLRELGLDSLIAPLPRNMPVNVEPEFDGAYDRIQTVWGAITVDSKISEIFSTHHALHADNYKTTERFWIDLPFLSFDPATGKYTTPVMWRESDTASHALRYQGDFLAQYEMLGGKHRTLAGYEIYSSTNDFLAGLDPAPIDPRTGAQYRQDIFNPDYSVTVMPVITPAQHISDVVSKYDGLGLYVQQQASFFRERLHLTASVRKDRVEDTEINQLNGTTTKLTEKTGWVPRYAVVYKPVPWASVYGLYSEHNDPPSVRDLYANLPASDPRSQEKINITPRSRLKEAGVKASLWKDKVTVAAAYYKMEREGTFIYNPVFENGLSFGKGSLSGEDLHGWEFEAFGRPTENLVFYVGYSQIRGTEAFGGAGDRAPISQAPDTLTAHVKWDVWKNTGRVLSVSAGGKVFFGGWRFHPASKTIVIDEDQAVLDLGASYAWANGRQSLNLRINNVENKFIVLTADSQVQMRQAFLSYRLTF